MRALGRWEIENIRVWGRWEIDVEKVGDRLSL